MAEHLECLRMQQTQRPTAGREMDISLLVMRTLIYSAVGSPGACVLSVKGSLSYLKAGIFE